jgi:elongation factor Ts
MTITSALVNELRSKTGVGMMDCKKALVAANGNLEAAIDWLRKQGMSAAAKKADREVKEGSVAFAIDGTRAILVELNCETDFVAKNEQFQNIIRNVAQYALTSNAKNLEELLETTTEKNQKIKDYILEHIAVVGENLTLKRLAVMHNEKGLIFSYVHNAYAKLSGKIAVAVEFESDLTHESLKDLGHKIAMHIAAMKPIVLNPDELDLAIVEKEKTIFTEQAKASGKPEAVIEKMVEGRIRKFYEEVVLNEQVSMFDGKTKIKDLISDTAKTLGGQVKIKSFKRFELGEIV